MKTRLILTAALFLFLLGAPAVFADVTEEITEEHTLSLAKDGLVTVEAKNGSIRVTTWDRDEVRVVAKKKARGDSASEALELLEQAEVRIEENADGISISAVEPRSSGLWNRGGASISFELTLPSSARLNAETQNGSVKVSDLGGTAKVRTQNGSLAIEGVRGELTARTQNGSIKAKDIRGAVDAGTTNGSITVEMDVMDLSRDVSLTTTNGSVELSINGGMSASINAKTQNGKVSSDFAGGVQDKRRKTLDLDLNGGGPQIELRSTNGGIRVREL